MIYSPNVYIHLRLWPYNTAAETCKQVLYKYFLYKVLDASDRKRNVLRNPILVKLWSNLFIYLLK